MSAYHYDLVFFIRARNVGDDVISVFVVGKIFRLDVYSNLWLETEFQHSYKHVVMLCTQDHARHCRVAIVTAKHEQRSMFAAARSQDRCRTGFENCLVNSGGRDKRR